MLKNLQRFVVTNNLHGIMFLSLTVNKNICCALVTDNTPYKTFSIWATKQKYISLKHVLIAVIAVMTVCVESCFETWSSNKKIYCAVSFTDNIHCNPNHKRKKHFSFVLVKTICAKACFQARPSNKNFFCNICRR